MTAHGDRPVVVITGASSGIGEALARAWAARGAGSSCSPGGKTGWRSSNPSSRPRGATCSRCDVSCDGEVEAALERARGRFGRMDVVVANAGFGVAGTLNELELDDYRRQLEVNVFGVLRTVYAALPDLKKARGRLAILGSINGYLMLPGGSRMR